jgi:hypothetical protein
MSADSNISQQPWIQRNVIWLAGITFLGSLALYFLSFNGPLSDKQGTWGEFGDYMGGVVNPIIGLCTVWLLTVSLRQNQIALQQAKDELNLARQALEASSVMQARTESALQRQVEIADQSRDMANAVAVFDNLQKRTRTLSQSITEMVKDGAPSVVMDDMKNNLDRYTVLAVDLGDILVEEAERIIRVNKA